MNIAYYAAYSVEHAAYHNATMRACAGRVKTMASQRSAMTRLGRLSQWARYFWHVHLSRKSASSDSPVAVGFGRGFWI